MHISKTKTSYNVREGGISVTQLEKFQRCMQESQWWLHGVEPVMSMDGLPLMFGRVLHIALEWIYKDMRDHKLIRRPSGKHVQDLIDRLAKKWRRENRRASMAETNRFNTSIMFTRATLPVYLERFWNKDQSRTWVVVEDWFELPYKLDDGRETKIIGKIDGGYLYSDGTKLALVESKSKARIDEIFLQDYVQWDLQTQVYCWALEKVHGMRPSKVLYNVIRRPQLRLKKNETEAEFAVRCIEDVRERPKHYFYRIPVKVTDKAMDRFELEFHDRVKQYLDWYEGVGPHFRNSWNCENKYGRCLFFDACSGRMELYRRRDRNKRRTVDVEGVTIDGRS